MPENKCKLYKSDGTKCEAWAMQDSEFCYLHNPEITEEEKKEMQSRGGRANIIKILEPLPPVKLKNGNDVIALLEDTINKVRAGEMDLKVANCIGYLAGHLIKTIDVATLENRVETVEKIILERRIPRNY